MSTSERKGEVKDIGLLRWQIVQKLLETNRHPNSGALIADAAIIEHHIIEGVEGGVEATRTVLNKTFWFEIFESIGLDQKQVEDLCDVLELRGFHMEEA